MKIPKTSFKIYGLSDGRVLAENPWKDQDSILEITRSLLSISNKESAFPRSGVESATESVGLLGILQLAYGKYLFAITSRSLVGSIQSHKLWRITGVKAIPIGKPNPKIESLSGEDLEKYAIDHKVLPQILDVLQSGRIYYSLTYDLTHSLQHNYYQKVNISTSVTIDDRYYFNQNLMNSFTNSNDFSPWITKCISGFVGMIDMDYRGSQTQIFQTLLVSRINTRRLGTRYVRRGLDPEGNAANNIEMEQIVLPHDYLKDKSIASFCQFRGSVPTIWGQDLDLSYKPRLLLTDYKSEKSWNATSKHLNDLKKQYVADPSFSNENDEGLVICVNLLDDEGFEGPLTKIYDRAVEKMNDPKFKFITFPMNKLCKKDYSQIELLLLKVKGHIKRNGWFLAQGDVPSFDSAGSLTVTQIQTGTTRVSCLDSLDRTNLTLTQFAKIMISHQIHSIAKGLPSVQVVSNTALELSEQVDPVLNTHKALQESIPLLTNLWADSGDAISLMYAGTGALKADVTRTGKRQIIQGSYNDGINSLTRYYLNNFTHGELQDTYDLITGKINQDHFTKVIQTKGKKIANRLKRPLVIRNEFPGSLVPTIVLDMIEPVYFNLRETIESQKKEKYIDRLVETLKDISPEKIENIFQLAIGLIIFFWIYLISRLLKIQGQTIVNLPKFSKERV